MPRYVLGWVDAALDQYVAVPPERQRLIDARIQQLLDHPDDPDCHHDDATDHWTTTDAEGAGLIVYIFRVGQPRLVILRLVY